MKIVDRKTFLALPDETLFSKYEPCVFGDLTIKGETVGANDFLTQQICDAVRCRDSGEFANILYVAQETGRSFEMDFNCMGRDGIFEDEQLFAIWDHADIIDLIKRLKMLIPNAELSGPL